MRKMCLFYPFPSLTRFIQWLQVVLGILLLAIIFAPLLMPNIKTYKPPFYQYRTSQNCSNPESPFCFNPQSNTPHYVTRYQQTQLSLTHANVAQALFQQGFKKWRNGLDQKAIDYFIQASKLGNQAATYNLAIAYIHGINVDKNVDYGTVLMTKLLEQSYPPAFGYLCAHDIVSFKHHYPKIQPRITCQAGAQHHAVIANLIMSAIQGENAFYNYQKNHMAAACNAGDTLACTIQKDPNHGAMFFQYTQTWLQNCTGAECPSMHNTTG